MGGFLKILAPKLLRFGMDSVLETDILKVDFFLRGQQFSFKILRKKKWKNTTKNHKFITKNHKYLVCACKSQDFALSQKNFARSHDH